MKVFLTGGSGFLGSHIADKLVEQGHEVRALVRPTSDSRHLQSIGAELVHASLETGHGLEQAVQGVDAVIHSAAVVKARRPEEFTQVNVGGTSRLIEATRKVNPGLHRFVLISSLAAHGFRRDGKPRGLEEPSEPVTQYGRSKLEAERAVLKYVSEIPVTVVRPSTVYGPRDQETLLIFKTIRNRVLPFLGSRNNRMSMVYGPDAADAVCKTLQMAHPSGRVYSLEDGHVYTQADLGFRIAEALGVGGLNLPLDVPIRLVRIAARASELYGKVTNRAVMLTRDKLNELTQPHAVCDGSPAREELGWSPTVDLAEGARRAAQWYRAEGWL